MTKTMCVVRHLAREGLRRSFASRASRAIVSRLFLSHYCDLNTIPKMTETAQELITDMILHFGGFKETLDAVVDLMRSEYPCSVIIRGNPGSGKRTVLSEAIRITGVRCVHIDPFQCSNDQTAIKKFAESLGLDSRLNMTDLMAKVRLKARKDKLLIILEDFPYFCRNRQSLLYNLMNLLHTCSVSKVDAGPNITLIGLTVNMEWADNIEKRVMSRLNAKCLELSYPYRNFGEYVQFASKLLGDHKIEKDGELYMQLLYMYNFNGFSVRVLKEYLKSICDLNKKGRIVVNFDPERYKTDYNRNLNVFSKERLLCLTRSQLDILKIATQLYYQEKKTDISVATIMEFNRLRRWTDEESLDSLVHRNVATLVTMGFIQPLKPDTPIGRESLFYPKLTNPEIRAVTSMDPSLGNIRTDRILKTFKDPQSTPSKRHNLR